jgi:hypothetical protein
LTKCFGQGFGRYFYKLIWSPCLRAVLNPWQTRQHCTQKVTKNEMFLFSRQKMCFMPCLEVDVQNRPRKCLKSVKIV